MPASESPSKALAEHILGRSLSDYIAEKRAVRRPRWSYRMIAEQLAEDTDGKVVVTGETVRQWEPTNSERQAVAS